MSDDSDDIPFPFWTEPDAPRLPRIALMGEFSAGKSTLANLMIGTNPLPVQVVATQLPPVIISYGTGPSVIVDLSGGETPCNLEALQEVDPQHVAFIRFFCEEKILTRCDLIDMPGISDPNMCSSVWERVLPLADGVIWCTPATQAWRQSEAAVWDSIDDAIRQNSMLVVTRADMLQTEMDRMKVMKRVRAETGTLFAKTVMMSLTKARDGADDGELWAQSGADDFVEKFLRIVDAIKRKLPDAALASDPPPRVAPEDMALSDVQNAPKRPVAQRERMEDPPVPEQAAPDPSSYMPKFS